MNHQGLSIQAPINSEILGSKPSPKPLNPNGQNPMPQTQIKIETRATKLRTTGLPSLNAESSYPKPYAPKP